MDIEEGREPTRALTESECWERILAAPYGRIAAAAADEIDIFPINHAVLDGAIVFRTAAGTKLLELTIRQRVAFEVDGADAAEAFSVVVKGEAEEFDRDAETLAAEDTGVTPWAPEPKDRWVRITPTGVSGRTFRRR
ncbi:pyridoxamine 5'-phosphate oxidase family protein [Microbacterium azadirachtae]|uniref:pyridoxamine 5'-phosphate oxidase family protein n=1 Tax=Microbacterium azadirachtae TaxID=582680 RepID=UPI00087F7BDE|nr:pyridoxamine 5'-phosphate oxidase family protein [Microbacterium azadirachtae]UXW86517.1 pyridoxamine 5'-phosphate oxidase family protein [Microbacterium azadirachtae]SDL88383.1 Nitroimidazol reductase NimA, pyridoxamine 5'-phosphate oxidase superfamily [Microbacterium azadirachtae]SEG18967.1 Nitroimidazol reductase NimA, pyridoxamine 5'-phosphate oxidase superfamily [Microbacterium azadirachtae]SEG21301.1 Nitroimidazol reductase NimA, pyridoxamine 5'-phosphate oxidase superfamily [Microbact